jgi:cyanophycin synthetase
MADLAPLTPASNSRPIRPDGGVIQFHGPWKYLPGYGHGLAAGMLVGQLHWPRNRDWDLAGLKAQLLGSDFLQPLRLDELPAHGLGIDTFLALVLRLEEQAQTPVMCAGQVTGVTDEGAKTQLLDLAIPTFKPAFTLAATKWLATSVNLLYSFLEADLRLGVQSQADAGLRAAQKALPAELRQIVNTRRIVRAAYEAGLACRVLPDGYLQIGTGRNAQMLLSTLTESTPSLGVRLARSKSLATNLLARSGLPATQHFLVGSADSAVDAAQRLGYPVVIKPDNLDGGTGVYAGLQNETRLRHYFELASQVSKRLLVEKHVSGLDHRITVVDGQVVKVIVRRPGGITGDGRGTVAQLVEEHRALAPASRPRSSLVSLDTEALEILSERAMTAHSIAPAGEFIALRLRANMSTGGTSQDAMASIHPDNARLAVDAARVLRLDVAGIDLIIPDISVSWLESGGAICEVNAQPQISTEFAAGVYRDLLARRIPSPAHLQTVLLLDFGGGGLDLSGSVQVIAQALEAQGQTVFSSRPDGLWLGMQRIGRPPTDPFAAAETAEFNRDASAAVAVLTATAVMAKGLPWHAIGHLCVVGLRPHDADGLARLARVLAMASRHLQHSLVMPPGVAQTVKGHAASQAHWQADEHGLIDTAWLAASATSQDDRPA